MERQPNLEWRSEQVGATRKGTNGHSKPPSESPLTISSTNPATGEYLGTVAVTSRDEGHEAVRRARWAAKKWARTSFEERAQYLRRANEIISDRLDEISSLISRENGKPRVEAESSDILPVIYHNAHFARQAPKILSGHGVTMPFWNLLGKSSRLRYVPWGVVGIISPWNYPFGIPMTQIAMALIAGNVVVMKPSSSVPLIGEMIREIWESTGLPEDVVQIIQGPGKLGEVLIEEPVDRLIFTGSVPIGRHLAMLAAERLLPITLELGGKDPAVVLADCDLDATTSGILWGAMANAGQTCAGIERVYVERPIYRDFVRMIVKKAGQLRVGADHDFDVDIGAITSRSQLMQIDRQVRQAVAEGAHVQIGGHIVEDCCGDFYAPTILTNVTQDMPIMQEENFGPVLPIVLFDSQEEAINMANDSTFALSASVWSGNRRRARQVAEQLEAGTVTINDSLYTYALAETPWGGFGESGAGKTHGREGLFEMVRTVHISSDFVPWIKKPWWYPYNGQVRETFSALVKALSGRQVARSWLKALRHLPLRKKL
ncbi:MAG: aldehyde dehydrogenase family protein [Candidatus Lernaella stagnicola]|nr:aldehyde dehydrogenase family protein [Candidatus Lernaella stagnicola]